MCEKEPTLVNRIAQMLESAQRVRAMIVPDDLNTVRHQSDEVLRAWIAMLDLEELPLDLDDADLAKWKEADWLMQQKSWEVQARYLELRRREQP